MFEELITIGALCIGGYFLYQRRKYPVPVQIFLKRANGFDIITDKAGRIGQKGMSYYRLKKRKENTKPSAYDHIMRVGRKLWLPLWSPGPGEYYPMGVVERPNGDGADFQVIDEDMKFWFAQNLKAAYERAASKSVLERYLPAMIMVLFAMCMVMLFYALPNYSAMIAAPWQSVASTISSSTASLQGSSTLIAPP